MGSTFTKDSALLPQLALRAGHKKLVVGLDDRLDCRVRKIVNGHLFAVLKDAATTVSSIIRLRSPCVLLSSRTVPHKANGKRQLDELDFKRSAVGYFDGCHPHPLYVSVRYYAGQSADLL